MPGFVKLDGSLQLYGENHIVLGQWMKKRTSDRLGLDHTGRTAVIWKLYYVRYYIREQGSFSVFWREGR